MARAPGITVITPFLDVADFLREAIDSVLAQTCEDWELVLVDDGSRDGSSEIARDYAARHPDRIRYVAHEGGANLGISASRNLGCRAARGQWIASLDGDDVWIPTKLAEQLAIIERHPRVGLVLGASRYWWSWTKDPGDAGRDLTVAVGVAPDEVYEPPTLLHRLYPLGVGAAPSMNTVLVRADVLDAVGGWEDAFRTAYEDQVLLTKLYLSTPVYVSGSCWDSYRQRPGSCMQVDLVGDNYIANRLRFLQWFEGYLAVRGETGTQVRSDLKRALRHARHPRLARVERAGRRALAKLAGSGGPP